MSDHAHSFNPKDNSLENRAKALARALRDHRNVTKSMDLMNKNQAHERLGTREEIQYALKTSQNTLEKELKSLSSAEIQQAQVKGLLSKEDVQELEIAQRKDMIRSARRNSNDKSKDYSKDR